MVEIFSAAAGRRRLQVEGAHKFVMKYDYIAQVHKAVCAVPSNGTFSLRVSTVSDSVAIKSIIDPTGAAAITSEIVVKSVSCPAQKYASRDGSKCLLRWCALGEELSLTMENCNRCIPGRFSNDGEGYGLVCNTCPLGRFCEEVGCAECIQCAAGTISTVTRTKCRSCLHGTHPNASLNGCVQCPIGKRGSFVATGTCQLCEAGKVSTTLRTTCNECPHAQGFTSSPNGIDCVCQSGRYSLQANKQFAFEDVETDCRSCSGLKDKISEDDRSHRMQWWACWKIVYLPT
jgi:hypothetical protein